MARHAAPISSSSDPCGIDGRPLADDAQQTGHQALQHDTLRQLVLVCDVDEAPQDLVGGGRRRQAEAGEHQQLAEIRERLIGDTPPPGSRHEVRAAADAPPLVA